MSDLKFADGLIVKAPHERAPEYVKAKISIHRERLIAWLQTQEGEWINLDVKASRDGKWYAAVDDWKPQKQAPKVTAKAPAQPLLDDDPIPF